MFDPFWCQNYLFFFSKAESWLFVLVVIVLVLEKLRTVIDRDLSPSCHILTRKNTYPILPIDHLDPRNSIWPLFLMIDESRWISRERAINSMFSGDIVDVWATSVISYISVWYSAISNREGGWLGYYARPASDCLVANKLASIFWLKSLRSILKIIHSWSSLRTA